MRVLYACCVVLFSAAFVSGSVWAQERSPSESLSSSCDQCSSLVEQHELLVQKITKLRGQRKALEARETLLIKKRQSRQEALLKLQARHAVLQQDELALAKRAEASAKTIRATLIAKRKKIESEEFEVRSDLTTLDKAIPQAQAAARKADRALDAAINERVTIMQAMANCEQRCIVADGPGTVVFTAASLADVAQSNQAALRRAARNTAACRDCSRLRDQIETISTRISDRQNTERSLRQRMTRLDRQRQGIRNEWRDLYDRYSDRLLARIDNDANSTREDRELKKISREIVDVNGRWQQLLTQEGQLQDQLMQSSVERGRLGTERRRLRAALGACEDLCVAGNADPANAGLRLASGRINVAKAEEKCPRCGSLARLVNEATTELGNLQTERDALLARFARVAPALEQIQARRRSIIKYAGELADLMDDFRQSGDVARAKQELAQISAQSQRLSTDIIRILDQREKLESQIDANADAVTRLSILSRQRRRELKECEARCNAPLQSAQITLAKPDLTFEAPAQTEVRCDRCATSGAIIDQLQLLLQSEQASSTVAEGQLKLHQARLVQADRALELNTRAIRDTRKTSGSRGSAERKNLLEGLQGEARAIRAERSKLRTTVESARATRDAIRNRLTALTEQIRTRRQELRSCESSCRAVSEAPEKSLQVAQSLIRRAERAAKSCKECDAKSSAMKEFAADIRSDSDKLRSAIRQTSRSSDRVSGFTGQIRRNRENVIAGVRRWFDLNDNKRREARIKAIIGDAFQTANLTKSAQEIASAHAESARERDKAHASMAGTLPSLDRAVTSYERCAETCNETIDALPKFDISEFQEQNPDTLIVKAVNPAPISSRCQTCGEKVDALNQMRNQRAAAAARVETARNITRSAGTINRRISVQNREIRSLITTLVQQRFQERNSTRKATLKTRLDTLETQKRQLERAKNRQDRRLRSAASDIDAARQDIRRLDREIANARAALRSCENQCNVASVNTDDDPESSVGTDNGGKNIARLPGADSSDGEGTANQDGELDADQSNETDVADATETQPVTTKCKRCAVFVKRITALSAERSSKLKERETAVRNRQRIIQSIRSISGSGNAKTKLVRERRKLTRLIEARNATIDRLESRLRRLRVSLARCEDVCKAPKAVASGSGDVDLDTTQADASGATSQDVTEPVEVADATASRPQPRQRRKVEEIVFEEEDLPRRKKAPKRETAVDRVVGGMPRVLGSLETLGSGEWETTVDVAVGTGNVWAPETATLSVTPAGGKIKLGTTTFAVTVATRDLAIDGEGTVAWGSIKVTRGDGDAAETTGAGSATRTAEYRKIRGLVGLGRETYDCLEGRGSCALGVMGGVEHTSLDDRLTAATSSQQTSVSNAAALLGIWGQTRIELAGFDASGLALILKGDAYVKGGRASGTISTAAISGTTHAKASSAYFGVGADLAAELELAFDQGAIAIGGEIGVDTLPTLSQNGLAAGIDTDRSTSSAIYLRGTLKF